MMLSNIDKYINNNFTAMKIHCSQQVKEILEKLGGYHMESRGKVAMKVVLTVFMYSYFINT
jgi:hypothetical protein